MASLERELCPLTWSGAQRGRCSVEKVKGALLDITRERRTPWEEVEPTRSVQRSILPAAKEPRPQRRALAKY